MGIIIFGVAALSGIVLLHPQKAFAASFVVNSIGDAPDAVPGDGSCDDGVANCTLRAAIQETNGLAGADTINFNIAGLGVRTISPGSALPIINGQVTIDGSTQPGTTCGTLVPATLPATSNTQHVLRIELAMSNAGIADALNFSSAGADGSILRGVVINGALGNAVRASNSASNITIECNYLGTNTAGTVAFANSNSGVSIDSGNTGTIQNNLISGNLGNGVAVGAATVNVVNNLIGTSADGKSAIPNITGVSTNLSATITHNVIAGNSSNGAHLSGANNVVIKGNYIGPSIEGNILGNQGNGIDVFSSSNFTIGGASAGEGNLISANGARGIHIYTNCSGGSSVNTSTIFGNYIGTKADGTMVTGYGNQAAGIEVNEYQASCGSIYKHQIGGDITGQPNIIAGNITEGILVHQDSAHDVFSISILKNSIFKNGTLGIDLAADSQNDGTPDTDLGPNPLNEFLIMYPTPYSNSYLNHPVVNSAKYNGNNVTVNYDFAANTVGDSGDGFSQLARDLAGYRLDFYLNENATDGAYPGNAQGKTHLGSFIVDGAETAANHTFTSPVTLTNSQIITVTATVLWKVVSEPFDQGCSETREGNGPPYILIASCN